MHILQPKHTKLSEEDVKVLLKKLNITAMQLPKIKKSDPALPEGCEIGDIIKMERKDKDKKVVYFRVVID